MGRPAAGSIFQVSGKHQPTKRRYTMELFEKLKKLVADAGVDEEKFFRGNNDAAGTRFRKAMQELKGIAQELREQVTAVREQRSK
jgi:uncharacterized protein YecE (DUF72 family)